MIRCAQSQFSERRPAKTAFLFWRTVRVHLTALPSICVARYALIEGIDQSLLPRCLPLRRSEQPSMRPSACNS